MKKILFSIAFLAFLAAFSPASAQRARSADQTAYRYSQNDSRPGRGGHDRDLRDRRGDHHEGRGHSKHGKHVRGKGHKHCHKGAQGKGPRGRGQGRG